MYQTTQETQEEQLLQLGQHIARQELVVDSLQSEQSSPTLQTYALTMSEQFNLDYTVVMTPNSIRLTHPDEQQIYRRFQGSDELTVFEGLEYTSLSEGTLGPSLRSFTPVFNESQEIIGAVSLGLRVQTIQEIAGDNMRSTSVAFGLSSAIGVGLAALVAYSLKKQMLDMEPEEIARVLEERNAMTEYTKDAVIATDSNGSVILANQEATKRFAADEAIQSQPVSKILPFITVETVPSTSTQTEEDIYEYDGKNYIVSKAPIFVKDKFIGNIYSLRDATELYTLLDQLYSTSAYATALQSQSHDFLNKLHVIYGLTDLEDYDELKTYLKNLLEPEQEFTKRIAYLVHNPIMAGFLVGERYKFSEKHSSFTVEIYPDIPSTEDPRTIQEWIKTNRNINQHLLKLDSLDEIHMELGYFDQKLFTTIHLKGDISSMAERIMPYVKDTVQATVTNNLIKLVFSFDYKAEKEK